MNIWTCLGAVALGASILEKHFTISRVWPGPDTGISIEPDELKDLIEGSAGGLAGAGRRKTILPEEQPVIDFAYATVVTIAPIKAGQTFSLDNIWVKRPGTGPILADRSWTMCWASAPCATSPRTSMSRAADVEGFKP